MRKKIKQAVILAGGLGTRLKAITDLRPKPLVEFHGVPFLLYIVEHLKSQNIKDILFLLGYLPEMFQEYFGDGRKFGVNISYSVSDVSNDTGRRIKLAENMIDDSFLLLYGDNYWPFSFEQLWNNYEKMGTLGQLSIYSNNDGYTKNNVMVQDGLVVQYDKSRTVPNLKGVEIGFSFFQKSVLNYLTEENSLFETNIYQRLIKDKELAGFVTDHRYYSVGSFDRLSITNQFFLRSPSVILDRDGVLNKKPPKAEYVKSWDEFEWLPGAKEGLTQLHSHGFRIIVVTNQAGIARGILSESDLHMIHRMMRKSAVLDGGEIDAIYYCPHGWDDDCECRKPKPGMLFKAQREFHLDLTRTYFVGDDERDLQAGIAAGCKTLLVDSSNSLLNHVKKNILKNN